MSAGRRRRRIIIIIIISGRISTHSLEAKYPLLPLLLIMSTFGVNPKQNFAIHTYIIAAPKPSQNYRLLSIESSEYNDCMLAVYT